MDRLDCEGTKLSREGEVSEAGWRCVEGRKVKAKLVIFEVDEVGPVVNAPGNNQQSHQH